MNYKTLSTIAFVVVFSLPTYAQLKFQKAFSKSVIQFTDLVKETKDGGFISLAYNHDPGAGVNGGFTLLKTNSNGVQWCKYYYQACTLQGVSIEETNDSGFIAAGYHTIGLTNVKRFFIAKFNSTGDTLWTKVIGSIYNTNSFSCMGKVVRQTSDGGYILTGSGRMGTCLIKFDANGDTLWTRQYGNTGYYYYTNWVQQTSDDGYVVGGCFRDYTTHFYSSVIKTDTNGDTLWTKTLEMNGNDIKQTPDNGFVLTGYKVYENDAYIIKMDSLGNVSWSKKYGQDGKEGGNNIEVTSDGGFLVGGTTSSYNTDSLYKNFYAFKTDSIGNLIWSKVYGDTTKDILNVGMYKTSDSGFTLSGGIPPWTSIFYNYYLIKADANGESGCNEINVIDSSSSFNILSSNHSHSVYFIDSIQVDYLILSGIDTIAITEDTYCANLSIPETNSTPVFTVYPNPVKDHFILESFELNKNYKIKVLNILGEEIAYKESEINSSYLKKYFSLTASPGIYFINIKSRDKEYNQKIIIN